MEKTTQNTPTAQDLLQDLQTLISETKVLITDSASDASGEALAALRARCLAAQERLVDMYAGAKRQVVAGAKCTDTTIRKNPYEALAVALGVGLVVGLFLGRRTK